MSRSSASQLVSTINGPNLVPGLYTVTESPVAGWTLADLDCTGGQVEAEDPLTGTAIVRLSAGQAARCVYRNEQHVAPTTPPTSTTSPPHDGARAPDRAHLRRGTALGPGSLSHTGPSGLRPILLAGTALILVGLALTLAARRKPGQHR